MSRSRRVGTKFILYLLTSHWEKLEGKPSLCFPGTAGLSKCLSATTLFIVKHFADYERFSTDPTEIYITHRGKFHQQP